MATTPSSALTSASRSKASTCSEIARVSFRAICNDVRFGLEAVASVQVLARREQAAERNPADPANGMPAKRTSATTR